MRLAPARIAQAGLAPARLALARLARARLAPPRIAPASAAGQGSGSVHRLAVDSVLGQPPHQVQALERELERCRRLSERLAALHLEPLHDSRQPWYLADPAQQVGGRHQVTSL